MSDKPPADSLVERILAGNAPEHVRSAAARGALPLPRPVLVRLYVLLRDDSEESIRNAARASLDELPPEDLQEVLGDAECAPEVLGHFAGRAVHDEQLAEKIIFHDESPIEALEQLADKGSGSVIELVLTNQQRLLREPALLDLLMANPALRPDQRGRILEFLERAVKLAAHSQDPEEAGPEIDEGDELDIEDAARLLDVDVGELLTASEILGAEELEGSDDTEIRTAFQRILTLSTAQKAILALKGGREERMILIRDTNKVVSLGVLKNARITDAEVEGFARMRNLTDDVLRVIGNTRDWAKNYTVVKALVHNPRTPQMISTNFVPRLTLKDLRHLVASREVPELIRRMAKRTYELRTQKSSKFGRKH